MAVVVITSNVTGIADEQDRRAMNLLIDQENARRAALVPPGTPLPKSTGAERKASYELLLNERLAAMHASYIEQAGSTALFRDIRPRWEIATDAQRTACLNALPPLP